MPADAAASKLRARVEAPRQKTPGTLRCAHCGVVIGVYEPLVEVIGGLTRETSRAAEPQLSASVRPLYHVACYGLRAVDALAAWPASPVRTRT